MIIAFVWFISSGWLPHVPDPSGLFEARLIVTNPTEIPQDISITAYDANGSILNNITVKVNAQASAEMTPSTIHPQSSHFLIEGTTIADMVYRAKLVSGPLASIPLVSNSSRAWRLRPGDSNTSWDGLAMVNLGNGPATVWLRAFDADGQQTSSLLLSSGLAPQAKLLHVVEATGATIDIVADQPLALIGLSGDQDNRLLWTNVATPYEPPITSMTYAFTPFFTHSFDAPVDLLFPPGDPDTAYVVQQSGLVQKVPFVESGQPTVFLDVQNIVTHQGEMGLLGFAFHPNYASNGELFINYVTEKVDPEEP